MAKNVDLGQALLPDHVSGAIWGSKILDPGRSRKKRWIRGLPIFLTPYVGLSPQIFYLFESKFTRVLRSGGLNAKVTLSRHAERG